MSAAKMRAAVLPVAHLHDLLPVRFYRRAPVGRANVHAAGRANPPVARTRRLVRVHGAR